MTGRSRRGRRGQSDRREGERRGEVRVTRGKRRGQGDGMEGEGLRSMVLYLTGRKGEKSSAINIVRERQNARF